MDISIAEAKAHLSELVEQAANGEDVIITKRGKPVAALTALRTKRKRVDGYRRNAVHSGQQVCRRRHVRWRRCAYALTTRSINPRFRLRNEKPVPVAARAGETGFF